MKRYLNLNFVVLVLTMMVVGSLKAQTYCTPDFYYGADNYIDEFHLGDISNTATGGDDNATYVDYTSHSTDVTVGESYDIQYKVKGNNYSNQPVYIFVDFNNDGDFEDADEKILEVTNETGDGTLRTINFTVPSNATAADTRLRIFTGYWAITDFCDDNIYNWGEVEDYTLSIQPLIPAPEAEFDASATSVDTDDQVTFTDSSTNDPTAWAWTFDPSTVTYVSGSASSQNPQVTFDEAGTYTVSLEATNATGSDTETKSDFITVVEAVYTPTADFTASSTAAKVGDEVTFTDASDNTPTEWLWSITPSTYTIISGDSTSTLVVTFDAVDDYTIELIASNSAGSDTTIKAAYVSVGLPDKPQAFFSANPTEVEINEEVTFTDNSTNNPTGWSWEFSPNNVSFVSGDETSQNPVVTFTKAGTYTVSLTASNLGGAGNLEFLDYITVSNPPAPEADFEANKTESYVDTTVSFTDLTTNNPDYWNWSFDPPTVSYVDGTSNRSQNPKVVFDAEGEYTVTLVAGSVSDTDTITKSNYVSIELEPLAPVAAFEANSTELETGEELVLIDQSENSPTVWLWQITPNTFSYLDGTDETSQNPVVIFDEADTYSVTLYATNHVGTTAKARQNYITVTQGQGEAPRELTIGFSKTTLDVGEEVGFTNTFTGGTPSSYLWSFSPDNVVYTDGDETELSGSLYFSEAGLYSVTLIASNPYGADTAIETNYITVNDTTPDNGGVTYDTTIVVDTNCAELFNFPLLGYTVNQTDTDKGFDIATADGDGLELHDNLQGWQSGYNVLIENIVGTDTSFMGAFPAWFNDGGQADDWLTFGPLTLGAAGGELTWKHFFAENAARNGYEILVGTKGRDAADFSDATQIWSADDNDAATDGDTVWAAQTASLADFSNQEIYIALHHNAENTFLLFVDDFIVEGCDTTVTVTIDSTDNTPTGDAPVASIDMSAGPTIYVGEQITLTDASTNNPTSSTWDLNTLSGVSVVSGGWNESSITLQFDEVANYDVFLTSSNQYGSDSDQSMIFVVEEPTNGGTTYDTTIVVDTNCAELFNFPLLGYTVNQTDTDKGFDIATADGDGLELHDNLQGWQSGYNVLIENIVNGDTTFMGAFPAWFKDGGQADDWLTFGPLTLGAAGGELSWKHFYAENAARNGYEILVGTKGRDAADFSDATQIWSADNNDATTDGDTVWAAQTASLADYANQEIYIALHHNAADAFLLFVDDFIVEGCDTTVTVTIDSTTTDPVVTPEPEFTADKTSVEVGESISFTDLSTNDPTEWSWSFSPNTVTYVSGTSTSQHPVVSFDAAGTYDVSLTAINSAGGKFLTRSGYITIEDADTSSNNGGGTVYDTTIVVDTNCAELFNFPLLGYTVNQTDTDKGFDIATADGDGLELHDNLQGWQSGYNVLIENIVNGDTTFMGAFPAWFKDGGQADDWLTFGPLTIGSLGGELSWKHFYAENAARNGYEILVGTKGRDAADFSDATQIWSADDNDAATDGDTVWAAQTASLADYANQEIYIALHHNAADAFLLFVDDFIVEGCDTTVTVTIDSTDTDPVGDAPVADFTASSYTVNVGDEVVLTDASSNDPTYWTWTFSPKTITFTNGDLNSQNPTVTFDAAGTYDVTLTVSNANGAHSYTKIVTVTDPASNTNAPVADFEADRTAANIGETVYFSDLSDYNPTSWTWSFSPNAVSYAGGTDANSENPEVRFNAAGTYSVTLVVSNANGSDNATKSAYITITDGGTTPTPADTTIDTNCTTIFEFPLLGYTVNDDDQAKGFGISTFDEDQNAVHDNLQGWQSGYNVLIENIVGTDTSFMGAFPAWFKDGGQADDWLTFGPLTLGAAGGELTWKHFFAENAARNGYEILVSTTGKEVADFDGADQVWFAQNNDAATDGDTTWTVQSASLEAYANQEIYIALHHNALDQFLLFVDDIAVESCDTTVTITQPGTSTALTEIDFDSELSVYPNPNNGQFTIRYANEAASTIEIQVLNSVGQMVHNETVTEFNKTYSRALDVRDFSTGVYYVKVSSGSFTQIEKVIVY